MGSQRELSCEDSGVNPPVLRLSPLDESSWPDNSVKFGLAIKLVNAERKQFHVMAIYRKAQSLMIGDLQWHLVAERKNAEHAPEIKWIAPDLSEMDQRLLASKIDVWLELNASKIPYSVAHPGGVIWTDNVWSGSQPGQGLTCATFILELFKELGIPFVDVDSWEERSGDREWAECLLGWLERSLSPADFQAQRDRIGTTVRIRPSDVVSAAHLLRADSEIPLRFKEVSPLAACIENELLQEAA